MEARSDAHLRTSAEDYLRRNHTLQEALSISAADSLELHPLGMGEHNKNYWFTHPSTGERFVLRINVTSQPFHSHQVRYEHDALKALEESGRTPRAFYMDDTLQALGNGALVISFCDGVALDFDHRHPGDLERVACILADCHSVPVGADSPLHRNTNIAEELFEECCVRIEGYRASEFAEPRILRWVDRFVRATAQALERAPLAEDEEHIVNTEPLPSHFLLPSGPPSSTDVGSFVDWERPVIGDVALDLAYFTSPATSFWDSEYLFPLEAIEPFLDAYWRYVDGRFSRGNFAERFSVCRMISALRAVSWCCRAVVQIKGASDVHITEKARQKLPIYLSEDFMALLEKECFSPPATRFC